MPRDSKLCLVRVLDYPYTVQGSEYKLLPAVTPLVLNLELQTVSKRKPSQHERGGSSDSYNNRTSKLKAPDEPLPIRKLLVHYPVMISVSNYVVLAFLNITLNALLPLFLAMPLDIGGLDFDPPKIGYLIGSYGAGSAIFQAFYFARIVRHFGEKKIFVAAISTFLPVFSLLPVINLIAKSNGKDSLGVWFLITIVLMMLAFMDMAYGKKSSDSLKLADLHP